MSFEKSLIDYLLRTLPNFKQKKAIFSRKFVNFLGRSLHGVCRENSQISRDVLCACIKFEKLLIDYFFANTQKTFNSIENKTKL